MELLALFLVGLAVGSFLNVLIYRLNTKDKVPKFWQGKSICPHCKHELSWKDNVPLLSFVLLRRRCRYCRTRISWQYPVVELVTALSFWGIWGLWGMWGIWLMGIAAVLIVIFFSDLIYGLIPDEAVAAGAVIGGVWGIGEVGEKLAMGVAAAGVFLVIVLTTRFRGMGLGDVKLAFLVGLLLGWPKALVAFWSAFVLGGLVAVGLLVLKRTKLSATIALGPFLVAGVLISALWSAQLLQLLGL